MVKVLELCHQESPENLLSVQSHLLTVGVGSEVRDKVREGVSVEGRGEVRGRRGGGAAGTTQLQNWHIYLGVYRGLYLLVKGVARS